MTTILLIRHAQTTAPRHVLLGRNDDVGISREGRKRAAAMAAKLRRLPIASVWCSPLRRAIETATVIAETLALPLGIAEPLNEIDYGCWTGCSFDRLRRDPDWRKFNKLRTRAHIPAGEKIKDVETRVARQIRNWSRDSFRP